MEDLYFIMGSVFIGGVVGKLIDINQDAILSYILNLF